MCIFFRIHIEVKIQIPFSYIYQLVLVNLSYSMETEVVGLTYDVYNPAGTRHKLLVEFLPQGEQFDEGFLYGVSELFLHQWEFPPVYFSGRFVDIIYKCQSIDLLVILVGEYDVSRTYPQCLLLGETVS